MRVLIFTNNYFPRISGVSLAVDFQDKALRSQGHDTFIIAPDYGEENGGEDESRKTPVHRVTSLSIPKKHVAVALKNLDTQRILGIAQGFRPDVIHCHHPFLLGIAGVRVADTFGIPVAYTFHTLYEFFTHYVNLDVPPVRRLVRELAVAFTNRVDLVVTPTEPILEYARDIGVSVPAVSIPTGIEPEPFRRVDEDGLSAFRDRFGLDAFDSILLNVGRITKEKNVDVCLDALIELRNERGVNCALLMFGRGPDEEALKKRAQEAGVGDAFVFGGFLDRKELPFAYRSADLFLFPSMSDTQGIVLYEAQVAGLPIVATDSMASRAIVKNGENGLFAEARADAFADAVMKILDQSQDFRSEFDPEQFSPAKIGERYTEAYEELINRGHEKREPGGIYLSHLDELVKSLFNGNGS